MTDTPSEPETLRGTIKNLPLDASELEVIIDLKHPEQLWEGKIHPPEDCLGDENHAIFCRQMDLNRRIAACLVPMGYLLDTEGLTVVEDGRFLVIKCLVDDAERLNLNDNRRHILNEFLAKDNGVHLRTL